MPVHEQSLKFDGTFNGLATQGNKNIIDTKLFNSQRENTEDKLEQEFNQLNNKILSVSIQDSASDLNIDQIRKLK